LQKIIQMQTSDINIRVSLDEEKMPVQLHWQAQGSTVDNWQEAKATMISIWDGQEKTALRIDLWTKGMMMDEMADFFYQNMIGMADTFNRATHLTDLSNDMKQFAQKFMADFKAQQAKMGA
jgi:gliding motility-associated protein GldC